MVPTSVRNAPVIATRDVPAASNGGDKALARYCAELALADTRGSRAMRKIGCEICTFRERDFLCDLAPAALQEFRAAASTSLYKPRQVMFSEGMPSAGLFLLCHGAVKLYCSDRFGHEHILEVVGPGTILGELGCAGEPEALSVSAETLTDAQLCFLPREKLLPFLEGHPLSAIRLVGALSRELAAARRKVRDLALTGAERRLAGLLL